MSCMSFPHALTVLLLSARVLAQGSGNCGATGQTLTIETDDDFADISNCTTVQGNIYLHGYTNEDDQGSMSLPAGLQNVQGGIFCSGLGTNVSIVTIQALGLVTIANLANASYYDKRGLVISDYANLTEFMFPALSEVGSDIVVARNLQASNIQFQSLSVVQGNLDLSGAFGHVSLPALSHVSGNINVQTSNANFVCPSFDNVSVGGSVNCLITTNPQPLSADNGTTAVNATSWTSASASASASASSSGSSGSSKSSASRTYFPSIYLQFSRTSSTASS